MTRTLRAALLGLPLPANTLTFAALMIVVAWTAAAPVAGQAPAGKPSAGAPPAAARGWVAPRTPWGDPDLQGTWTTDDFIGVPIERPVELGTKRYYTDADVSARLAREEERARQAAKNPAPASADTGPPDHWGEAPRNATRQTSFVVEPADGRIPAVTPEAQKRAAPRDRGSFGTGPFNTFTDFTNFDRCIGRGVVGSMLPRPYNNGLDIVQAPGYVALRHEMIHEPRIIPIGPAPRLRAAIRQYSGDSRGRWEGDTLVVETTNFTDQMSIGFNGNGLRHSEAMHLTERFRRISTDAIEWQVTIDDPKTYTRPFTIALLITSYGADRVYEYACHEGNYGMLNMLSAARAAERAAGTK
jgi:hypothetical protein